MKPVIMQNDFRDTVTVGAVHAEKVHRLEAHTHQGDYARGLNRLQNVGMGGHKIGETGVAEVEKHTVAIVFEVRIEAQEQREAHHKYKMEIGERAGGGIEPGYTTDKIREQTTVALLSSSGIQQEFGNE